MISALRNRNDIEFARNSRDRCRSRGATSSASSIGNALAEFTHCGICEICSDENGTIITEACSLRRRGDIGMAGVIAREFP